jgi:type VI secretion system protein ImpC
MRLLVVGDFSAHPRSERPALAARPTWRVDADNLDDVLKRLAPRCAGAHGEVAFASLDDFHPDALHARLAVFDTLRQARSAPPAAGAELLGSLLGGKPAGAATAGPPAADPIDALIRRIVTPHIVPDTLSQTRSYVAAVDTATAELMRRLLHDPAFQALEAAWRGVQWLVQNLELDATLELHLFDATRDELLADLVAGGGRVAETGLWRALGRWRGLPDGAPWSLIAGLYRFGGSDAELGLLAALGLVARHAGGAFVAHAEDTLTAAPGWQTLRTSEAAAWLGMAAPRLLLRQPYGAKSDPISAFAFEETSAAPQHEQFLWGSPALAVALLAGRGGGSQQIDDLPAVSVLHDGERELIPCAERWLDEEAGRRMIASGLMPLASHRHANAVTLMRLQSVAQPPTALPGLER